MTPSDYLAAALLIIGGLFFLAGTLGLLRFPDVFTRLHALTKADNVGLGLTVAGLAVQAESWAVAGKLLLIWALVLYAILPVLRNTMVGLDNVDRSTIEAGRGMGMTKRQVLTRIELPLAVPVIIAGVRTALIINIGMAPSWA